MKQNDRLFYGWVVVAAFLVICIAILGTRLSFGVFFKSIQDEFGLTRAATSSVLSVYMLFCCVFGILCGWALDRYGPRIVTLLMGLFTGISLLLTSQANSLWQLFISYSLLLSIGTGTIFVVRVATVSRWFDRKRGFALGIAGAGAGLGPAIMAPLATYLISNVGWRWSYIIMGLIAALTVIPLSLLLRKDPSEIGLLPDGAKSDSREIAVRKSINKEDSIQSTGLSLSQASRTISFWVFGFIWLLFSSCSFLVSTHIVPHATDMGISAMKAAAFFTLYGVTYIAGQVMVGKISDSAGRKTTAVVCTLVQVGVMVWLIWLQGLWTLYLFALVYGFASGGLTTSISALISDTFGLRNIGMIFGTLEIAWSVGAAVGPAIGGLIFDASKAYSMAFLIGAAAMLIVTLIIPLTRRETSL